MVYFYLNLKNTLFSEYNYENRHYSGKSGARTGTKLVHDSRRTQFEANILLYRVYVCELNK